MSSLQRRHAILMLVGAYLIACASRRVDGGLLDVPQTMRSALAGGGAWSRGRQIPVQGSGQSRGERDSAGILIAEFGRRTKAQTSLSLDLRPSFDVGGMENPSSVEFNHKHGFLNAVRLASGGFAVADLDRIHYFNARSERVRVVGRRGQGPKEFSYLTAICRTRGDTLVVNDDHNRRFAIIDEMGTIVRTVPRHDLRSSPASFCLDDGTIVVMRPIISGNSARRRVQLLRMRLDGSIANLIGEVTSRTTDVVTQAVPYLVTNGERVFWGDGATSQIVVFSKAGSAIAIVRDTDARIPIEEVDVERRLGAAMAGNQAPGTRMAWLRANVPRVWPAFGAINAAPHGELWVQRFRRSLREEDTWTAFDTNGRLTGRVIVSPPSAKAMFHEVLSFGRDDVLLRWYDGDGAVHLTVLPIARAKPLAK